MSEAATKVKPTTGHGLKLRAETAEDITVFAAVLQDAVTVVGDMAFRPGERRFVVMLNRYLWEQEPVDAALDRCMRVRTGLHFDGVLKVAVLGIPQTVPSKVLELLTIECEERPDTSATLYLFFAGGGIIRLDAECIDAYLTDIGEPWPARCRPCHAVDTE